MQTTFRVRHMPTHEIEVTGHALERFRRRFDRAGTPESVGALALAGTVLTVRQLLGMGIRPHVGADMRFAAGAVFVVKFDARRGVPVVLTVLRPKARR